MVFTRASRKITTHYFTHCFTHSFGEIVGKTVGIKKQAKFYLAFPPKTNDNCLDQ